jgi:hypothetical protein
MSVVDLGAIESFGFGNDPVVIIKYTAGYPGGKVLDVDDFTEEFIRAGHIIVKDTSDETFKPLGVSDGNYKALGDTEVYAGVAAATKSVKDPFVSVMFDGVVNDEASPYPITEELAKALKEALPNLSFIHE